jgi:hypothetical protein
MQSAGLDLEINPLPLGIEDMDEENEIASCLAPTTKTFPPVGSQNLRDAERRIDKIKDEIAAKTINGEFIQSPTWRSNYSEEYSFKCRLEQAIDHYIRLLYLINHSQ